MERLQKTFFEVLKNFELKKEYFKKRIEKWRSSDARAQGHALLRVTEQKSLELKNLFTTVSTEEKKREALVALKQFKSSYKELHQLTKPEWRQWVEALVIAGIAAIILRNYVFGLYHVPTGSAEPTVLVGDRVWGNKMAYLFGDKPQRGELIIFDEPQFRYAPGTLKRFWQKYVGLGFFGLPEGPINVVKRVIAVPGDWIEGRVEDGKPVIYLNNKKLDELYVNPFPLIGLYKERGLIPFDSIGFLRVPDFLRKVSVPVWYTYDPEKSFSEQPFYAMERTEVIRDSRVSTYRYPHTPSYKDEGCADVFGPMRIEEGKYWVMGDSRKNSQDSRWFGLLDESLIHGRLSFIIYSVDSQESLWIFELLKHPIDFWFKSVRWNRFFKKPTIVQIEKN